MTALKLMEMTVQRFLDELASNSPAPGGGSVAALAGALAAGLVSMVARLTGGEAENDEMRRILSDATELLASLNTHVDEDTEAFNMVMQAYRLPKQSDAQKQQRSGAIQLALMGAARHPLVVSGECLKILRLCREVVASGNPNALSDAGVAALMAYSGITGAMFNVAINLEGIKDPDFVKEMLGERDNIISEAATLYADIQGRLLGKMSYATGW